MASKPQRSLWERNGTRVVGVAVPGLIAAYYVAQIEGGHAPKPLELLVVVAGAVVMFNLTAEQLLLGWLFLAPLLQESAGRTRAGHLLALGLYTGPPVVIGLKVAFSHRRWVDRQWYDALPALFVGYVFVSLAITDPHALRSGTVGTVRGFLQVVAIGPYVYYLVSYWPFRAPSIPKICRVMLLAVFFQSVMTTIEWGSGWNLWHDPNWHQAGDVRAIGTLSNPSVTGGFIGVGVVIAITVLSWKGPSELRRLSMAVLVVSIPGIVATKTRGPILATVLVAAVAVLLSSRSRARGIWVIGVAAMILVLFLPRIEATTIYKNRINQQENVEIRVVLQTISIKLAEQRPVFGWGYDSFDRIKFKVPVTASKVPLAVALQSTSHDTFLTLLVEYGAVGLALFVAPWIFVFRRVLRAARHAVDADRWVYVAGLAAIAVIGVTGTTLDFRFFSFAPAIPWLFLGLLRRASEETQPRTGVVA